MRAFIVLLSVVMLWCAGLNMVRELEMSDSQAEILEHVMKRNLKHSSTSDLTFVDYETKYNKDTHQLSLYHTYDVVSDDVREKIELFMGVLNAGIEQECETNIQDLMKIYTNVYTVKLVYYFNLGNSKMATTIAVCEQLGSDI